MCFVYFVAKKENTESKKIRINVTSKDIFDKSITDIIKAFVNENDYNDFMEGNQKTIVVFVRGALMTLPSFL